MSRLPGVLVAAIGLCMVRCGTAPTAGGSIETTNGFAVAVVLPGGAPATDAVVRVRPSSYLAQETRTVSSPSVMTGRTDTSGKFGVGALPPGDYSVEINDTLRGAVLLTISLVPGDPSLSLGTVSMLPHATVTGLADSVPAAAKRFVQVYGLERRVPIRADGTYMIADLPEGTFTFRLIADDTDPSPVVVDRIRAESGVSLDVRYRSWTRSRQVTINTTTSGSLIDNDVARFPLLVRLDSTTMTTPDQFFTEAADLGSDVRITKPDGTLLPFEIEYWNRRANQAALWVLVDTVYGDSEQSLTLYYGNSNASALSSGASVFNPAQGFAGVWHLAAMATGQYPDATGSGNGGTRATGSDATGIAGQCALFTDSAQYIDCGNAAGLSLSGTVTISAWISMTDVSTDRYRRVVSKKWPWNGAAGYEIEVNPVYEGGFVSMVSQDSNLTRGHLTSNPFLDSQWYHLAASTDGSVTSVYLDGMDITDYTMDSMEIRANNLPLVIGGKGSDWFEGLIDEVRVESVVRDGDWVRLSFETQQPQQTVVTID